MRNLSLSSVDVISLAEGGICGTAVDLDENVLYIASEKRISDGAVNIEIYRMDKNFVKGALPESITMFSTKISGSGTQLISLRVIQENRSLVAIMRKGDIITTSLDDEIPLMEVQGSVDDGFLAAAWSPDDSLLALITGTNKLILMTLTFDVISEAPLETTEFGQDAPINVGWGSKQTQFHGSIGKAAAQASTSNILVGCSPDEDNIPRISWRGDGACFVVSSITTAGSQTHRILRVYDHQAVLQSTSESVPGLEHSLSWRPSGNLIASTQRFGFDGGGAGRDGRHDLVFFERNGLRHGDFELRPAHGLVPPPSQALNLKWGYKVKDIKWSSDSNVLAIWIGRDHASDLVQLWTTSNYHWYLKQEISAPSDSEFTSIEWHPEIALHLILTTHTQISLRTYAWEIITSLSKPPIDSGSVAVSDGSVVLLTPFRTQNVPPPMSSMQLALLAEPLDKSQFPRSAARVPVHTCFSPSSDVLGVLWEHGYVEVYHLRTRLGPGRGKVMQPTKIGTCSLNETNNHCRQIVILASTFHADSLSFTMFILGSSSESDVVVITQFDGQRIAKTGAVAMTSRNGRLVRSSNACVWEAEDGKLFRLNIDDQTSTPFGGFSNFCFVAEHVTLSTTKLCVGLTGSGKLQVCGEELSCLTLANNATSFAVASGYLIFTTGAHEAVFAPMEDLPTLLMSDNNSKDIISDWEKRRVERGSRIVVCIPSSMSLVLQMPRGNLETINPRPLVLEVVRQDLNAGQYRKAFFSCRKHRIDLNFLVAHNEIAFLEGLGSFVEQVHEVEHLNLFLTSLGQGTSPLSPKTIATISDALREKLEKTDLKTYVNTILTAHIVKAPSDHESALSLLLRLKGEEPALVEDAVKYIIFLVDADKLFDTALGMYDFSLVLMIAQHSQKDPREYLPFLRELRAIGEKNYQKYRIDDLLKRYKSALNNLARAGPSYFDEAIQYIERHSLYQAALSIWSNSDRYEDVLTIYGDWLFERRDFRQAAAVFVEAKRPQKAMVAYEKALEWQELFELALRRSELVSDESIEDMAYRVSEDLVSKKRFAEAARVILDYTSDVKTAVITLVQGHEFSEALRITTLKREYRLIEDVIHPGALESTAQIVEDVTEMKEQLNKQLNRIRELRVKKVEEPDEFYGFEDTALHNVDVMTDVSMAPTAFTRYTVAPSAASRSSKRSSRSKRKMERKVGSGRKGTVDEEEYLLRSIGKLVGRFSGTRSEGKKLLAHLIRFTAQHREDGLAMQRELSELEAELNATVEEIWATPTDAVGLDGQTQSMQPLQDTWAVRMDDAQRQRKINPMERIAKPQVDSDGDEKEWKMKLFDLI
ncbi:IkappaB kinase complex IKAP component [Lentinula aff. lateritia]|uniref:IkappaB kinase complex IKAP component n=1 Tax=Lentinula aff. lateritia TaxID=2804960 RepID=A0ACC1TYS7_9AGAR|nr:IkappaB kinase complex IKAP component [Lentinula aff. lateritia]